MNEQLLVGCFTLSWGKKMFSRKRLLEHISMLRLYPGAEDLAQLVD